MNPAAWLAFVALSNPMPTVSYHSGIFYQVATVNYWSDRHLVPRWLGRALTREESSFRTKLETRGPVVVPNLPKRALAKFLAKYPGYRWDSKNKHVIWVILSHGMLQTNPRFDREFAAAVGLKEFNWRNPDESARVGIGRLAFLLRYFDGDAALATASYNCGIARLESSQPIPNETLVFLGRVLKGRPS